MQDKVINIVFLADTHLGYDYPIKPRIERRRRGEDFFNNFKKALDYAIDVSADMVIHGGDFFFRAKIPEKIVAISYEILYEFAANSIPFLVVPGNHERSRLPESLLMQHPSIFVFDKPRCFSFDVNGIKLSVSGFPFVRKNIREEFVTILKKLEAEEKDSDISLLLMHHAVEGAKVGPVDYTFRSGPDVIDFNSLPGRYHAILSGHIHRKQVLYNPEHCPAPVIYPGSTERTAFAEKDEDKGFYHIKFEKSSESWKMTSLKFRKLYARPMVDITLESSEIEETVNELKSKLEGLQGDTIIRLVCISRKTLGFLTAEFLRSIIPKSMNVEIKGGRYRK